jgi:hypothetical protein
MAKVKAGEGSCPVCENRIVWRQSESGAVSCFCQDCDLQVYAKDGTEAKRLILSRINHDPAAPKADKPEAASKPAPAPPAAKKSAFGVFGL